MITYKQEPPMILAGSYPGAFNVAAEQDTFTGDGTTEVDNSGDLA
jgi:hypothetical protein